MSNKPGSGITAGIPSNTGGVVKPPQVIAAGKKAEPYPFWLGGTYIVSFAMCYRVHWWVLDGVGVAATIAASITQYVLRITWDRDERRALMTISCDCVVLLIWPKYGYKRQEIRVWLQVYRRPFVQLVSLPFTSLPPISDSSLSIPPIQAFEASSTVSLEHGCVKCPTLFVVSGLMTRVRNSWGQGKTRLLGNWPQRVVWVRF